MPISCKKHLVGLFIEIIAGFNASSNNHIRLSIVFGLSGAAIGLVGGSVWGYATALVGGRAKSSIDRINKI